MDSRWLELDGKHKGETGIIIGNGPSLKDVPNEILKRYPSIGTNKIYLKDGFTPTYYVCINPYVIMQVIDPVNKLNCLKFVREQGEQQIIHDAIPLHVTTDEVFSTVPHRFIFEGYTVTYVAMQLAYFMGFQNLLMYGVDHRFNVEGDPNDVVKAEGADINHFHPDYFKDGDVFQLPDLKQSEKFYRLARKTFEYKGRKIYNMNINSALDVFERMETYAPECA